MSRTSLAVAAGATAMALVGGCAAVSAVLVDAPLFTVQALRYAVASVLLVAVSRAAGHPVPRPRGAEWLWLGGVAGAGMVLFNIALVRGARHAEPAVLSVAVACAPLLLAGLGPLARGRLPTPSVLTAAAVVTGGATLVQGLGHTDAVGLAWAAVVLGGEAGFTLLAVPVLDRLGPHGVSVHTTWLAAAGFAGLGLVREGPAAMTHLRPAELLATGYLGVLATPVAFVLWYTCVDRLGPGRAGLLSGVVPVAAAAIGTALGAPAPRPAVWVGIGVVACGLALGLRPGAPVRMPARVPTATPDPDPAGNALSGGR